MRELQWAAALHIKIEHNIEKGELSTTIKKKIKKSSFIEDFFYICIMKMFSYYKSKNLWWFRIYGRGLFGIPTKSDWVPFSIRYKHRKTIKLFGHYIGILKKEK